MPASEPLLGPVLPAALEMKPQCPDRHRPSFSETKFPRPQNCSAPGWKGLKSHLVSLVSLRVGVLPPASFLPVLTLQTTVPTAEPREGGGGRGVLILGQEDKARSNETQDLQ